MVRIVYVEPRGAERVLDVPEGWTVMQGAVSPALAAARVSFPETQT